MTGSRDERPEPSREMPEEPFFRRWARRKEAAREQEPAGPLAPAADASRAQEPDEGETLPAAEAGGPGEAPPPHSEPTDLPPLDSLTAESDFGAFMRPGVDPVLRRTALRKMFRNPKYAVVDPLDPYRVDYGLFTPLGDMITADMKFHAERLLKKAMDQAAEAAESTDTASPAAEEPVSGQVAAERADATGEKTADRTKAAGTKAQGDPETPAEDDDEHRDA
jgi:hypothetical protein